MKFPSSLPPPQNGFLKRLPHNERKSSALSKLLKSDRFWAVFSVHDELHPFLELWNDPTEVSNKPPIYVFPLAVCQHIRSVVCSQFLVSSALSANSRKVLLKVYFSFGTVDLLHAKAAE